MKILEQHDDALIKEEIEQAVVDIVHEKLSEGLTLNLKVLSGSMHPLIKSGDNVAVKAVDYSRLKVGDIVAYRVPGAFRVHRIIELNRNLQTVITKGDNTFYRDSSISISSISGIIDKIKGPQGEIIVSSLKGYTIDKNRSTCFIYTPGS